MYCQNCGTKIEGNAPFCSNCGTKLNENQNNSPKNTIPISHKPISMWGYFGYQLLFAIPIVGFISLLVFAFGSQNVNVKNFARSYFCWFIIGLVLVILFLLLGLSHNIVVDLTRFVQ